MPKPETLQDYLALVPTFPAAPAPVRVTLPHAPGRAAYVDRIPTTNNVAFITIDDGWHAQQLAHDLIQQSGIPVTAFLTIDAISDDVDFFASLQASGMAIENHTLSHPCLIEDLQYGSPCAADMPYEEQSVELCSAADQLGNWYGRRPTFFRPPYLKWNDDTLRAAWDCGITAGFSAKESVENGVISWAWPDHRVHAGDIIVMHFIPSLPDDFIAALQAIKAAGLTPALLEDYVDVS